MKPLQQGELDSLCGMYAVVNAVRHCAGGGDFGHSRAQALFKRLLQDAGEKLPRLACSGSDEEDMERYLRVALALLWRHYKLALVFDTVTFRSMKAMREGLTGHLAKPHTAALVSVDYHMTVVMAVHGDVWELLDSYGYKYLHCAGGKIERRRPLLRAMPELEAVLLTVTPCNL